MSTGGSLSYVCAADTSSTEYAAWLGFCASLLVNAIVLYRNRAGIPGALLLLADKLTCHALMARCTKLRAEIASHDAAPRELAVKIDMLTAEIEASVIGRPYPIAEGEEDEEDQPVNNLPPSPGTTPADMSSTTTATASSTAAAQASATSAIIGSMVNLVVSTWAGKSLNVVSVVSIAVQLVAPVETLLGELQQLATTETVQEIVSATLTQVLTTPAIVALIDASASSQVCQLLVDLLPLLLSGLFAVSADVEASGCFPCCTSSSSTATTGTIAAQVNSNAATYAIKPVHYLRASAATPATPAAAPVVVSTVPTVRTVTLT